VGFLSKISDLFTSTRRPAEGTPVQPLALLQEKLLALNRSTAPYQIISGVKEGVDYIVTWKLEDLTWRKVFKESGDHKIFQILLKFNEARHEVRALDRRSILSWSRDGLNFSLSYEAAKGQMNEINIGGPPFYIETMPDGTKTEYRFAANELKKPVQQIVTDHGWTYKGVAFEDL
jgi:hypothetical protein